MNDAVALFLHLIGGKESNESTNPSIGTVFAYTSIFSTLLQDVGQHVYTGIMLNLAKGASPLAQNDVLVAPLVYFSILWCHIDKLVEALEIELTLLHYQKNRHTCIYLIVYLFENQLLFILDGRQHVRCHILQVLFANQLFQVEAERSTDCISPTLPCSVFFLLGSHRATIEREVVAILLRIEQSLQILVASMQLGHKVSAVIFEVWHQLGISVLQRGGGKVAAFQRAMRNSRVDTKLITHDGKAITSSRDTGT